MKFRAFFVAVILVLTSATLLASGDVGIFGIVEKVVFEPNETSPERIQVWGAFAFQDGTFARPLGFLPPRRGYIYFSLPDGAATKPEVARKEWADLKSVAGTGQAVAFGIYLYRGALQGLQLYDRNTSATADLRIHDESEPPSNPVMYSTNAGVVKVSSEGGYAFMVTRLKQTLVR